MTWTSDSSITEQGWKICPIVPSTTSIESTTSTTSTTSTSTTSSSTSMTTTAITSTVQTTTSMNEPMWEVVLGECTMDSNSCVMSPNYPNPYPALKGCTILVHQENAHAIRVEHFETEELYDTMA